MARQQGAFKSEVERDAQFSILIRNLLAGRSIAKCAERMDVTARTIRKWVDREDFKAQYEREKANLLSGIPEELTGLWRTMIDKIRDGVESGEVEIKEMVTLLRTVGDQSVKSIQATEFADRLAEIEERLSEVKPSTKPRLAG